MPFWLELLEDFQVALVTRFAQGSGVPVRIVLVFVKDAWPRIIRIRPSPQRAVRLPNTIFRGDGTAGKVNLFLRLL